MMGYTGVILYVVQCAGGCGVSTASASPGRFRYGSFAYSNLIRLIWEPLGTT